MTSDRPADSSRSPWRAAGYPTLAVAFAVSRAGYILYTVAVIVTVLELTGSAAWVSAAIVVRVLPVVLLGPFGGVVADRFDRASVVIASDLLRLVLMLAMAAAALAGAPAAAFIALTALVTIAGLPSFPAVAGLLPDLLDEDQLPRGNSVIASLEYLALIVGPGIGALLLLLGDTWVVFTIDAATFAVSAALMLLVRRALRRRTTTLSTTVDASPATPSPEGSEARDDEAPDPRGGVLAELREGIAVLVQAPAVRAVVALACAVMFVYGAEEVYAPLVSLELLGTGEEGVGWLDASVGVGGVLGAVVAGRLAASRRVRASLSWVVLGATVPLALLSVISIPALAYVVLAVEGAAAVSLDVIAITTVQRVAPRALISRVDALLSSMAVAALVVGNLVAPLLLAVAGLRLSMVLVAVIPAVISLVWLWTAPLVDTAAAAEAEATADIRALLEAVALTASLPPQGRELLARTAVRETLDDGAVLIRQGDPAEDLYLLASGTVEVFDERGERRLINTVSAPDHLGEIGVVHRRPRTATVVAAGPVQVWRIAGTTFLDATAAQPFSSSLVGVIDARLARASW